MTIELTPQTIITAGAVIGALVALATYIAKAVRWVDQQKKQTTDIKELRKDHVADIKELREQMKRDQERTNEELTLMTYGVLACLKGLKEKGCNGPVTEAINKIEKHLNKAAHDQE